MRYDNRTRRGPGMDHDLERQRRIKAKKQEQMRRRKLAILKRRIKAYAIRFAFLAAILVVVGLLGNKIFHWFDKSEKGNTDQVVTDTTEEVIDGIPVTVKDDTEETEKLQAKITLTMIGDMLLHDKVEQYSLTASGKYDYTSFFENIADDIASADLALVSQEVIIGGKNLGVAGYPDFNAPNEMADDLVEAGFDVILHASNHAYDKGELGITNCLTKWNKSYPDMTVLGIHKNQQTADQIYYYEQDGITLAILNYTYGINGDSIPSDKSYLVDILEETKVREDIKEAKANADFVIVCPHWGTEYSLDTDTYQQQWAEIFLDEGVDLVIGSHPHVIEKVEMMEDTLTGHQMLVYYSLGNFVNWTAKEGSGIMNRFVGGMANVTIGRTMDGEVKIADWNVTALVCHVKSQVGGITVYKLSDYNEDLAKQNEVLQLDDNFSWDYAKRLCQRVWGDNWQ